MFTNLLQDSGVRDKKQALVANKKGKPIWVIGWFVLGFPLITLFASSVTWAQLQIPEAALPMIFLVGVLYVVLSINLFKVNSFLSYKTIGITSFYTTAGFLFIFSVFALFRIDYSRVFLGFFYSLTLTWFVLGTLLIHERRYQFVIIAGGIADNLRRMTRQGWYFIRDFTGEKEVIGYDGIVVDMHVHDDQNMLRALANSSLQGTPILHAASVYEKYTGKTPLDYLAHEGIFTLVEDSAYNYLKRLWEVALITLFSPVILLFMGLVAIAVKLDSKGPVLFKQKRIGKHGKEFMLYKFRSMKQNAELNGAQFAQKNDTRVTKFGKFIRKFRIDELPQFWNVLKGDMSLIGPRPEQPEFVEYFKEEIPFYSYRNKVRPGITGWAQVKGGYASDLNSTQEKLEYDLYYVKNLSLSLDLLIVYATIKTIITGFGSR